MKSRIRTRKKRTQEQTPNFSTAPAQPIFQSRSFVVQTQQVEQSQQPDLKTSLMRAERYGHHLARMHQGIDDAATAVKTGKAKAGVMQLADRTESSSQQASESGRVEGEQTEGIEIPSIVHFIWIGKKPSAAALENINTWAKKATNTNWKIILWTDRKYGSPTAFNWWWGLEKNIENRDVKGELDERLKSHYDRALARKAWNMASDLARYSILLRQGGVYADVDIGPGKVNLKDITETQAMFGGELPLLGPGLRDKQQLDQMVPPDTKQTLRERVKIAMDKLNETGEFGNHFIATPKRNQLIERIIQACERKLTMMDDSDIEPATAMMTTGPTIVLQQIEQYLSDKGVDSTKAYAAVRRMNPELGAMFANLDWLTEESQNQTHK